MAQESVLTPPGALAGRRFFLVAYLPTAGASLFVLVLVWAGARGWEKPRRGRLGFRDAWSTGAHLGAAGLAAIAAVIAILSFVLYPLQSLLLRLLESQRPYWLRRLQAGYREKLLRRSAIAAPADPNATPDIEVVRKAGIAGYRLRQRFALEDRIQAVRATGFGNALAAAADQAGRPYGLDAAVTWPRLYPVLGDQVRGMVDDRRDSMDAAARMAVAMAVTTLAGLVLLCRTGPWLLLVLVPLGLSVVSYFSAVQAAVAYGEAVRVAFDLHRFDLLKTLKVEIPDEAAAQKLLFSVLSDFWRQGIPPTTVKYKEGQ